MHQINNDKAGRKRLLTEEQRLALVGRLRIGDLNKLFRDRYGGNVYPDDDDGRHSLMILLQHYARNNPLKVMKIIKLRAPWMPQDEIDELLGEIADNPRSWRSKTLGRELNFTGSEWRRLRLRTIAPINMTKAERDQDTKLRKRQRMRIKRRIQEGRTPRAEYEANGSAEPSRGTCSECHGGHGTGEANRPPWHTWHKCVRIKIRTYDTHLCQSLTAEKRLSDKRPTMSGRRWIAARAVSRPLGR